MATRSVAATREILVINQDGSKVIVGNIPSTAKITFGPVRPGKEDFGRGGHCVRIYTSLSNQLAVFEGVRSFRDLTLTVQEQVVTVVEESESVVGAGRSKRRASRDSTSEWVEN